MGGTLLGQGAGQKPLRVGLGLLGATYVGDLNTNGEALHRFYPGMGFSLQFVSPRRISPQLNTGFGKFVAQDRNLASTGSVEPNTFVQTPFFYVDFRLKARFLRERTVSPYLSAGIGLLGYTPKDEDEKSLLDNSSTREDGETYGSITAGFPLSVGTELRMSPFVALGLEYTYRLTGSDYLDNIGLVGPRAGKDKLQNLMLSFYFTFDPERTINPNDMRGRDRR
jgi:opacity protein-like surface antigen